MKMTRPRVAAVLPVVLLATVALLPAKLGAQEPFPTRPVTIWVAFPPGGGTDILTRALAEGDEKILGQKDVVINKPGATGVVATAEVVKAKPDGYTLVWMSGSLITVTNLGNLDGDWGQFDHVARIAIDTVGIAVRADAPWKTFQEFIAEARKNPGKIRVSNSGAGSFTHLGAVAFEIATGAKFTHAPLGVERRVPSLLSGEVEATSVHPSEMISQLKAGQVRFLAITSAKRDPAYPDVPTLKELGYDMVLDQFRGISVPKGTPKEIIKKLEEAFRRGSEDPGFQKLARESGFTVSFLGQEEFVKYLAEQNEVVKKVLAQARLQKKK